MRIMQTKFGPDQGNCLQACVATIFGLPLSEVDDFNLAGERWFAELVEWAGSRSHGVFYCKIEDDETLIPVIITGGVPILTYTVVGTDEQHAIVGKIEWSMDDLGKFRWAAYEDFDPNPNRPTRIRLTGIIMFLKEVK